MAGRNLVGPEADALDLGTVFRALGDEHRRSVMTELAADRSDSERGCNSFDLPISKQTQTHHFRVLREAGLIDEIDYGNRKGIRLRRADIEKRFPGLLALLGAGPRPIPLLAEHRRGVRFGPESRARPNPARARLAGSRALLRAPSRHHPLRFPQPACGAGPLG